MEIQERIPTLSTLNEFTDQEIFEYVVKNLLKQNHKSIVTGGACSYRGENNRKCAIGFLISDNEYIIYFEGKSFRHEIFNDYNKTDKFNLLDHLQYIHDKYNPEDWKNKFKELSANFNLNCDFLNHI